MDKKNSSSFFFTIKQFVFFFIFFFIQIQKIKIIFFSSILFFSLFSFFSISFYIQINLGLLITFYSLLLLLILQRVKLLYINIIHDKFISVDMVAPYIILYHLFFSIDTNNYIFLISIKINKWFRNYHHTNTHILVITINFSFYK